MQVFTTRVALQQVLNQFRLTSKTIGLVPTMGNLHSGHLALIEKAKQECDFVLATIFVNPMQFGPDEDFERYPNTLESDKEKLLAAGCDALFTPSVAEMYPNGLKQQTTISVPELSSMHCGKSRPGHFDGVCTIVSKLLNLTNPDRAYFGCKDYQQLFIIRKMVTELCMPMTIVGVPTIRDENGLALSSRNGYLSQDERLLASTLSRCLNKAADDLTHGTEPNYQEIEQEAQQTLTTAGLRLDYFTICNALTLMPATQADKQLVILAAVYLGKTRLIDNIEV